MKGDKHMKVHLGLFPFCVSCHLFSVAAAARPLLHSLPRHCEIAIFLLKSCVFVTSSARLSLWRLFIIGFHISGDTKRSLSVLIA